MQFAGPETAPLLLPRKLASSSANLLQLPRNKPFTVSTPGKSLQQAWHATSASLTPYMMFGSGYSTHDLRLEVWLCLATAASQAWTLFNWR